MRMKATKYLLILMIFNLLGVSAITQVNFSFNASLFGKDLKGLSTVQIINTSTQSFTGVFEVQIKQSVNDRAIVRIIIDGLTIISGSNTLPQSKLNTAQTEFSSSTEGNYTKETSTLPEGDLDYCFKFTVTSKINEGEIFENCFTAFNTINTPLNLISPDYGDKFCNKRPKFSWQPQMPIQTGTNYSLKLVEVKQDQVLAEALLVNTPIILQNNIKNFVVQYPAIAPDLKEKTKYAWQVTSNTNGKIMLSEVWEFTIDCPKEDTKKSSYREINEYENIGVLTTNSVLKFAINNPYVNQKLKYSILDVDDVTKVLKGLPSVELHSGMNYIEINLNQIVGLTINKEYLISVILPNGKKASLRFKHNEDND